MTPLAFHDLIRWAARMFSPCSWPPYSSRWEQIPGDWSPALVAGARLELDEDTARRYRRFELELVQEGCPRQFVWEADDRKEAEKLLYLVNRALARRGAAPRIAAP